MRILSAILLASLDSVLAADFVPPACRWAANYAADFWSNADSAAQTTYLDTYIRGEAQWIRGLGTDPLGGWTLDGQRLDIVTGLPCEDPHNWTAASKECMQFFFFARILYDTAKGNECLACKIWSADEVVALMTKKMAAYQAFNGTYPGFGSYLPWMKVDLSTGVAGPDSPTWDNHVPALDNAELFWPAWATAQVLKEFYASTYPELTAWVDAYASDMMTNAKTMFYNPDKPGIRTDSYFVDQTKTVAENSYYDCKDNVVDGCIPVYLDDPYEGELFLDMIVAFPDETKFTAEEITALWESKRAKLLVDTVTIDGVEYGTEQGYTFSSHEKWKYLMAPYLESPMQQNVFYSGEKIRTMYAATNAASPGLWGAMTGTMTSNTMDPGYHSDVGIPELASQPVNEDFLITPYGAYPVILANRTVGMAWLHNMIISKQGQNCYGTTEGFHISGKNVSSLVTWDTKVTNVMALVGGITDITKDYLVKLNKLQPLVDMWEDQWKDFGSLQNYDSAVYAWPKVQVPTTFLNDFSSCSSLTDMCDQYTTSSTATTTGTGTTAGTTASSNVTTDAPSAALPVIGTAVLAFASVLYFLL